LTSPLELDSFRLIDFGRAKVRADSRGPTSGILSGDVDETETEDEDGERERWDRRCEDEMGEVREMLCLS
jgi:hypothetical protein